MLFYYSIRTRESFNSGKVHFIHRVSVFAVRFLHERERPALCSLPLWVAAQQGAPETSLSRHFHQVLWGNPREQRNLIPTAFPRFALGSHSGWTCLKHLPWEGSRSYPDQMPFQLQWLLSMQRSTSSNLSSSSRSKLLTPLLRLSTRFTFLSFPSLTRGHDHSRGLEHRLTGHLLIHSITLMKTLTTLIHFPISSTKNHQSLRFCTSNWNVYFMCNVNRTPETIFPSAQMWVQWVETHQHSGQFPMLLYPAMCTGAIV